MSQVACSLALRQVFWTKNVLNLAIKLAASPVLRATWLLN